MHRTEAISLLAQTQLRTLSPDERESRLLDCWAMDPSDAEFQKLHPDLQSEIVQEESPSDSADAKYDPLILLSIEYAYLGVRNEFIASQVTQLLGKKTMVDGEVDRMLACPCCGYLALPDQGHYSICPVCWWEDDGGRDRDMYSGPNHMTLREGMNNYRLSGVCDPKLDQYKDKQAHEKYNHVSNNS